MRIRLLRVAARVALGLGSGRGFAQELPPPRVLPPKVPDQGLPPPRVLPPSSFPRQWPPARLLPPLPSVPRVVTMPGGRRTSSSPER